MIHTSHSQKSQNIADSQRVSRDIEPTAQQSSPPESEIQGSLPRSGPSLNVDLLRFRDAINQLPVGELHEACRQRFVELLQGKAPVTYAELEAASARLNALSDEQRTALVKSFFKTHQENPILCPFPGYHDTIINGVPVGDEDSKLSKAMARSILESGIAPFEDIELVAFGVAQSLLDHKRDLLLSFVGMTGAIMVITIASTLSVPTIIAGSMVGLAGFRYLASQPHPHNEACAGYVREHLDLINAVLNYNRGVDFIGDSLNSHYNDPSDKANYGALWRASGFLLARTARILGTSTSVIEKEFRSLVSIDEPSEALTDTINSALTEQKIPPPQKLLAPFIDPGPVSAQCEQYFTYLDEMNYCYITWAASEARVLRGKFAEAILAA